MWSELAEEYPEATPYIREAVRDHGEEWVIKHYFPEIASLGVLMDIPSVEELPFYDEQAHDVLTEQAKRERAEAYRAYRANLRNDTKADDE
jgi:hypothetical protein